MTSLPYWNADDVLPCMYAGYINTDITDDHNLFYWLFGADSSKPLVVWLNGGPGASSMFGLFLENGPLRIISTGDTSDDWLLKLNEEGSWADIANILYID